MKKMLTILFALTTFIIFPQDQFTEQISISLTGVSYSSVAWGDYDNDGDLDILLTGHDGSNAVSKIYRNDGGSTFTEQTSISLTGIYYSSVDWGDYDNDGDLDILLSGNVVGNRVSKVYSNNGDNTFTDQTSISLVGYYSGSARWGDYNNDGDLDLVLSGFGGSTDIYRNNGDNSFTGQIALPSVSNSSVAWGDYDNDGDLDILLTGFTGSNEISKVYKNNGDNTFTEQTSISLTGVQRGSIALGDYDNDGDLDILLCGLDAGNNHISKIYRNDSGNIFSEQTSIILHGVSDCSVAWGDYDNDGNLDILLTGGDGASAISKIYRNNGNNTFTEQSQITLTGVVVGSVAWGDYDNDGDLDILLTGSTGSSGVSKIYRNNNTTANTTPSAPTNLAASVNGNDVTFSWDKSNDTETSQNGLKYNLVIGTSPNAFNTLSPMSDRSTGYRRVINLGNTNHNNSWTIKGLPDGQYYWSVQAIDNAFAGSNFASEQSFTKLGQFTEQTSIILPGVHQGSVNWGDFDNDGDLDILLTGYLTSGVAISKIYRNDGVNTFTEQVAISLPGVGYYSSAIWGDYDNDGDLDILLAGTSSSGDISKVYRNDGGAFTDIGAELIGVTISDIDWGDYDNDGDLDILLTGASGDYFSKIYRNDGGLFTDIIAGLDLAPAGSAEWGDYDNDGDLDILITGNWVSKVYRNDNGTFTDIGANLIGLAWTSSTWGDYDNDGDLDILHTGYAINWTQQARLYRNDSGIFNDIGGLTPVARGSVDLGDYDNDGDLDILLTGSGVSKIYRNNGDNTFAEQTSIALTGVSNSSVAWGDYDNDGDLDILLTGGSGSGYVSKIYRNNNITANTIPSAPTNLAASVNGNDVTFSWDKSTDTETPQNGLKYNLVIGTSPNAVNTLSPMSDRSTGYRRVINLGNTNHNNSWTIKGLVDGLYYWSVQAIDNAFAGSNFAPEKRFAKPELFTEQTSISLTGVYRSSVAWGDYDNDGDLDILMIGDPGGYTAFSKIYQNNAGSFTAVDTDIYPTRFGSVDWGDYDNDGDLDVLLTGFNGGNISRIYRNDGSNIFTDINAGLTPLTYSCGKWGDYDNDGDLDILMTGGRGGEIPTSKIYRNDVGVFNEITTNLTPAEWSSVAWGDYDNDGDLDIVITGAAVWGCCPQSNIYRNDGDGNFTNINAGLMGVYYSSVKWGDCDNDGDLDLMLAGWNGSAEVAKVYRNDNGIFTDLAVDMTGVSVCSVAWGDYDNDGDLDILLTGYDEPRNVAEVYRNNGDNTFTKQTSIILEGVSGSSVGWGDYDNDGDLDILLTGHDGSVGISKIYRNNYITPNTIPNIPTNLSSVVTGNQVILSWNKSTDPETPQNGLKYNIVVGSNPGTIDKLSPMSDRNNGYRKIVNFGNANHSNDWAISGLPMGNYYWSVQTIDNNFAGSNFATEQTFRVTHFTKNWISLYQPMNIYVTSAAIDGVDLGAGDEIAVFDGNNCVGIIYLDSPIPSGGYASIIVSADDLTTTEIDGFVPGNPITYKFWDSQRPSEITRMTESYSQGAGIFEPLESSTVGLAGIYTIDQEVDLRTGWSIFSLRGTPDNINMLQLLNPLITSGVLIKVQDERGFAVEQLPPPIGWINSIGNWASTEGYYIKLNLLSSLSITGPPIALPLNIPLRVGWNIISYPIDTEQNAMTLLNSLIVANQLIKVQDEDGNAIEKLPIIGWINNIGNFESGEGYYMKVNAPTNLILDAPIAAPRSNLANLKKGCKQINNILSKPTADHFQPVYTSPYLPMNFYVTGVNLSGGVSLGAGDEIGIFDGNYCVGSIVLTGPIVSFVSLIASTDNLEAGIDGFIPGHTISYKFWLSATSTEITNYNVEYSMGDGTFASQGTAVVSFENVLPIELTSFVAKVINNQVTLKWITSTEVNNYGFEIERKSSDKWQKIGFVQGNGNSNSLKDYSYLDKSPIGGNKFLYRLKQIDNDGLFEYSSVIEIDLIPNEYALYQNYPNPFNPVTKIRYQLPKESKVIIKIYNILGSEIMEIINEEKKPGIYEVEFNANNLASGTYIYKLSASGGADNFIEIKKLILLK